MIQSKIKLLTSIIKVFFYLLLEYLLIIRTYLKFIFINKPPQTWSKGEKGNVIILPGYNAGWIFLYTLSSYINKGGYRVFVIPKLDLNHRSVQESVKELEQFIDRLKLNNVILLGHSMGGLIGKYFIDNKQAGNKIKLLISIATPYKGTIFGFLRLKPLKDLSPGSKLLRLINEENENNNKIYNIYSKIDNHIIPNGNAHLEGAYNRMIDIVGHTRILEDERLLKLIEDILSKV